MKFRVTIQKENGPQEVRVVDAPSRFAVYGLVEREGGKVVTLQEVRAGLTLPAWLNISIGTGISQNEIVTFAKNLSAMLSAGLSLSRALAVIERQAGNKQMKKVVGDMSEAIKRGASFHDALAEHSKVFSNLFIAMARAGEESGSLSETLQVVGLQMERTQALIRKVRGAMIYPSIVVTAIIIVGILMLIFVVPTLTKTFTSLGVKLPLATQIIVAISNFLVQYALLAIPFLIALIIAFIFFVRSERGSRIVLFCALHMPVVGELVRETYAARTARTLASLLSASVPVLDALSITEEVVHAPTFTKVIDEALVLVKKGDLLSSAFVKYPKLYPPLMSDMLSVGEETGKVADMLKQIAEFYEEDVSERTKDLSTIIEPVLMLMIGAVVGVFAVSMIAPIYSLSSAF